MGHTHNVYDTDTHFSINPITRMIKNESSKKVVLVQHDHNSERFTFELPRQIEGHDMSLCNLVEVHYLNLDAVTKEKKSGLYTVTDLHEDGEHVVCSWLISQNATSLVGSLNFLLRFACVTGTVVDYAWNTAIFTGITISDGINAGEMFEEDYADIIAQWKAEITRQITDDVNASVTEWAEKESGNLRGMLFTETAKTNTALAAERARIDQMVSGATADDAELIDIRVGADGVTYDSAGTAVREQTGALNKRISTIIEEVCSPNRFDEKSDKNTRGAYLFYNGTEAVVGSDYSYSYPISVVPGELYISKRFDTSLGTDSHYIIAYDANGAYHSFIVCEKVVSNGVECNLFTAPAGVHYVRVNYMAGRDFMFVHGNEYPAEFIEYYNGRTEHDAILNVKYPFSGKVMVNFGDSIFGMVQTPNDISTYLQNIVGGTVYNAGFGGCRMGRHTNASYDAFSMYRLADAIVNNDWTMQDNALQDVSLPDYFAARIVTLKGIDFNSVDIITISYGTNDFADGLQPGEFVKEGSNQFNYYTTALKYSIETIQSAFPQIRIFILTPCWRCWIENGEVVADGNTKEVDAWPAPNGITKLTDFVSACWDVAKTFQIPVIDNYNIGMNKFNHAYYLTDGTHHTNAGRRFIAEHIAKKLF